jgi:putative tricarboxylic transport membrane protein
MSVSDSTEQSDSADDGHSTGNGGSASAGRWNDRVLGVVCLAIAIWYTVEARTFEVTAFGGGPVGPKTLPTAIGVIFGALSLVLIVRPDRNPRWPTASGWWQIGLVVLASYGYGRVMEPIGFIVASAAMFIVTGLLFRAPLSRLVPASVIFPIVLAFVFNNWLELHLPAGWWGGF